MQYFNVKKISIVFFILFILIIFVEIFSRIFFSTFSKSFYPLFYGFNKSVLIHVEDLSSLNFNVQNLNIKKVNYKKLQYENNKKIIWVFGGSTSDMYCYNGTWSDELQILLPEYRVLNFATGGASTDINLNKLLKNKKKELPSIILWANRFNEDFILYFGTTRNELFLSKKKINYEKNNYIYIIKSTDLTLKKISVFYYLFDDLIGRIIHKIAGPSQDPKSKYYDEDLKLAVRNYEINTEAAIKFSKVNNIDFYIVSLFGKYDYEKKTFFTKPLYPILKQKMIEITEKWNIYFIDTENNLVLDKKKNYFCDNVHQTFEGNRLTAETIKKKLIK